MKIPVQYKQWLKEVKNLITAARTKAILSVNEQLLLVYWQLGQMIVEKQKSHLWGDAVIEQLSNDLQKSFPEMKGFSRTNLFNCKKWYLFYSDKKVQQLVGLIQRNKKTSIISVITKIPWATILLLLKKLHQYLRHCFM